MMSSSMWRVFLVLLVAASVRGRELRVADVKNSTDDQEIVYYPSKCSELCTQQSDFEEDRLNATTQNRGYQWSMHLLSQLEDNVEDQSPPAVARALALFSACMYNSAAAFRGWRLAYVTKILDDHPAGTMLIKDVLDGAAFTAMTALFTSKSSFAKSSFFFRSISSVNSTEAHEFGDKVCKLVIDAFEEDGFSPNGDLRDADPIEYIPINRPQETPGVTNCEAEIRSLNTWQPLCVPDSFPLNNDTKETCTVQEFLSPHASRYKTFSVTDVKQLVPLTKPPQYNSFEWRSQAQQVLELSKRLRDETKMMIEHWEDGVNSTFTPGHWFKIALQAIQAKQLDAFESTKVLLLVGAALNDAGAATWTSKLVYESARPQLMIQCGLNENMLYAWSGPYRGLSTIPASQWQPYQNPTVATAPVPGYVSDHSAFSSAAAKVLELYFGSIHYIGPKCSLKKKGSSFVEGKITGEKIGLNKSLTDVPNSGPSTPGYSPGQDVVLCWESFSEAAEQAGISRLQAGVQIDADHRGGKIMGENIANFVFDKASSLWPV